MANAGKDRRTYDECIEVRQVTVANETTAYCKYFELRGDKYCNARLKYSNVSGAKTVGGCHRIYYTKTTEKDPSVPGQCLYRCETGYRGLCDCCIQHVP